MQRKLTGRTIALIFIVLWALYAMLPLKSGDLMEAFKEQASNKDAIFEEIVQKAETELKQKTGTAYQSLYEAAGTNDLSKYFPNLGDVSEEENPNLAVLNRLQKSIAGKIRLGLDIKGGTSFLVGMQTTKQEVNEDGTVTELSMDDSQKTEALSKAVEILRKRVDSMGVAEPQISPSGSDRVEIALPGLSEAENEAARRQIERAAFLEFRMVHPQSAELLAQDYIEPGYEVLTETMKENIERRDKELKKIFSYDLKQYDSA